MSASFDEHLATARALLEDRKRAEAQVELEAARTLARSPGEQALVLNGLADVTYFLREDRQGGLDLLDQSIALALPQVDSDPEDTRSALALAEACSDKSDYLIMMHRADERLPPLELCLDRLLERATAREPRDEIERQLRAAVAWTLRLKIGAMKQDYTEQSTRAALAHSRDLIRRFHTVDDPAIQRIIASPWCDMGVLLGVLGRSDEQIATYNDVIARYGAMTSRRMREIVLRALEEKLLAFREQEDFEATLEVCDDILERYEPDPEYYAIDAVARTLIRKGDVLNRLGKMGQELACYDRVVATWADDPEWPLRKHAAEALLAKAAALSEADQAGAEMECYDELLQRYAEDPDDSVRAVAAAALVHRGLSLRAIAEDAADDTGVLETDAEIACYDRVIARYGDETSLPMRRSISSAYFHKGESLLETGRRAEAADCFDAVLAHPPRMWDPVLEELVHDAKQLRAEC